MDVFFYSGSIGRGYDLEFIKEVYANKASDECLIIMTSGGGSPDAAYKMARYLQYRYEKYTVLVSGMCKSAATLFAIGANEVVFSPFGELGPLDIQLQKEDKIAGQESGLNISEAFSSLEAQATATFNKFLVDIIRNSGGVVSFKTASEVAIGMISSLYGPIFSQIEPEEVGSRTRAMRIGEDYAKRLDKGNLKPGALEKLSTTYASHGFVIDYVEATSLFNKVRLASEAESAIIDQLGEDCRFPNQNGVTIRKVVQSEPTAEGEVEIDAIENLEVKNEKRTSGSRKKARTDEKADRGSAKVNGGT